MGPDRDTFTTIDALYSAVSLREPLQLERCAKTLDDLHAAERLPKSAHQALQGHIAEARAGQWKAAQENLRRFMLGQHRWTKRVASGVP